MGVTVAMRALTSTDYDSMYDIAYDRLGNYKQLDTLKTPAFVYEEDEQHPMLQIRKLLGWVILVILLLAVARRF